MVILILACFIIASAYFAFFIGENDKEKSDKEPPKIISITGNTTVTAGETVTIVADFTDNVNVTKAVLFYKSASDSSWKNKSILNGSITLDIPPTPVEDWYYYIIVNDAAGNGPVGDPSVDGTKYYTITVTSPSDGNNDNTPHSHTVFIEESTAMSCKFCPAVGEKLHELYESGKYDFYYVTLVQDNPKANDRLTEDYNLLANPTVYIDGGYEIIVGNKSKSEYENKIQSALSRNAPDISVTVHAKLDVNNSRIIISGIVTNNEADKYTGTLKVYLTEIISTKWQDYKGKPYHFAFLEFAVDETITVSANDQKSFSKEIDSSDLDPENLMIFAVVFNSEKHKKYSYPEKNENPFDAYYADAVNKTAVVEERNLPPEVGITHPKRGKIHIFSKVILESLSLKNTILLGRTTVTAQASDDSDITKVEFYLDDQLVKEFTSEPYEWTWKTPSLFRVKHTIKVIAYDNEGKTSTATMDVIAFILL